MTHKINNILSLVVLCAVALLVGGDVLAFADMFGDGAAAAGTAAAGTAAAAGVITVRTVKGQGDFWRAGTKWTETPRVIKIADLGAGDEERLRNEPKLVVESGDTTKAKAKAKAADENKAEPADELTESPTDFDRGFTASDAEKASLEKALAKQYKNGVPPGEIIKVDASKIVVDKDRPAWAKRGVLWVSFYIRETSQESVAIVAIFDVRSAAEAWLAS